MTGETKNDAFGQPRRDDSVIAQTNMAEDRLRKVSRPRAATIRMKQSRTPRMTILPMNDFTSIGIEIDPDARRSRQAKAWNAHRYCIIVAAGLLCISGGAVIYFAIRPDYHDNRSSQSWLILGFLLIIAGGCSICKTYTSATELIRSQKLVADLCDNWRSSSICTAQEEEDERQRLGLRVDDPLPQRQTPAQPSTVAIGSISSGSMADIDEDGCYVGSAAKQASAEKPQTGAGSL